MLYDGIEVDEKVFLCKKAEFHKLRLVMPSSQGPLMTCEHCGENWVCNTKDGLNSREWLRPEFHARLEGKTVAIK